MNSERLKDFRQAAYELVVRALLCHIRADGCSDDHQECVLFGRIFTQPAIQSTMVKYL
ncbi:hypothetical protein [Microcoleus sp.]|uniref:hypothetical protein n=1 Tax=Microcoleus sp. TaxID=44472 RepID=UPI00403EC349